ncbi:hypothetical protein [Gilvimarinus polysaccharolyticus]|uniref:hypothetical protein n=1 Tax=Gilvimarinus polysaccharolyticus TaxID=863921 RepID=UPI0006736499|nr:hypothetical protein [Gilvimarinus polysaccharolyticus]
MNIYTCAYRYKKKAWLQLQSLDEVAIKEAVQNFFDKGSDYCVGTINCSEHTGILHQDDSPFTPYIQFIQGSSVLVGDMPTNSKGGEHRSFYTSPEHLAEAKVEMTNRKQGMEERIDRYYDQLWV